ncbi:MAG: UDP-2,4-diacetamido-2,4,6-trideoxy-beta-L-altropyranose hydrolase [Pseudomonadota bacterium]
MKVAFRVDASLQIGSGHVMRCLTLADALAVQGAQCYFLSRELVGNLLALIRQRGYAVDVLPAPTEPTQVGAPEGDKSDSRQRHFYKGWLGISWEKDAEQTRTLVEKLQPDWLVIDHYALDQRWEDALRPHFKKLMVIDDLADRAHQCDLLLDQNLGRAPLDYMSLVPAKCKVLTGPRYALLRPEFALLRAYSLQRRQYPVIKQLLITMGGVDQSNTTGQVLQALRGCRLPPDCSITVVMGLQASWLEEVRALALDMPWPTEVQVNINDMAQCMADSDLAIGAAGSTSWERCCLGLPTLLVVLADNQRAIAEALQGAGAAKTLNIASAVPEACEVLSALVADPRALHDMSIAAAHIVDGLGTASLVSHLSALENS